MAGDWIPVRTDLHAVPEVLRLARLTGRPVDEVVGLLVRFWAWAQAHTDDGCLAGVDLEDAASGSHVPSRFLGALVEVHWLVCDPGEGLQLPNFGRWMSGSAKARLRERVKKRRQRASVADHTRSPPCPDSVPILSRCDRDRIGTTEEKRREENSTTTSSSSSSNFAASPRETTATATTTDFCVDSLRRTALGICTLLWPGRREPITDSRDQRLIYQLAVLASDGHRGWIWRLVQAARQTKARQPLAWVLAQMPIYAPPEVDARRLLAGIEVPRWSLADPRAWPDPPADPKP